MRSAAIADDPHLAAVKLVERAVHPTEGPVRNVRPTLLFDGEPVRSESPAQPLGSDTRKVLAEAGYSDAEIDELVRSGAAIDQGPKPDPRRGLSRCDHDFACIATIGVKELLTTVCRSLGGGPGKGGRGDTTCSVVRLSYCRAFWFAAAAAGRGRAVLCPARRDPGAVGREL